MLGIGTMALRLTISHVGPDATGNDLAIESLHEGVQRIIAGYCLLGGSKTGGSECRAVIGRRATTMVGHCDLGTDVAAQVPRERLRQLSRVMFVE